MDRGDRPETYVALDLETTGLNADQDAVIEIGALKFQGPRVLETFQTLVNPYRDIPPFVRRLTGIAQRNVNLAPPFAAVSGDLRDFIGTLSVVGHNISFDLNFLAKNGLPLDNESHDTWDLASILLPYCSNYSLLALAAFLGADHPRPHRALSDAQATHRVFLRLLDKAGELDPAVVAYMRHLASRAGWPLGRLLASPPLSRHSRVSNPSDLSLLGGNHGLTGLDFESLSSRLAADNTRRHRKPIEGMRQVDVEEIATFLAPGGLFSRTFPGFEHRPEQVEMLRAVTNTIDSEEHLIVEAGTGVGKSLAYLLPALLYSLKSGERVVVSTNTINLQEQLLHKDVPALVRALEEGGIIPRGEFRVAPLKGRANYLCLRRWNNMARAEDLGTEEARLLSKTLMWLQDTYTGDRGEINLSGRDFFTWNRVSAGEKGQCPGVRGEGICFLRAARDKAEDAHLVIVNHALLLSDLARGGGLLPDYQHLIIDEAQHLEEEATRQLGFQVSQNLLTEQLDTLGRLQGELRLLQRGLSWSGPQVQRMEEMLGELDTRWSGRARDIWDRLWSTAEYFVGQHQEDGTEQLQLRITRSTRAQPGWSEVEIAWENVAVILSDGVNQMERLRRFLDTVPSDGPADLDTVAGELSAWQEELEELRSQLKVLLAAPAEDSRIDWIARISDSGRSYLSLRSAPLNVGPELVERLFSRKSSVVLTSATLSSQGNFDYIRERVGLEESNELLVGSPFDYSRAALLLIPQDIPSPTAWGYQQAMEKVLIALGKALQGHVLVLFTSHSSLRGTAGAIRAPLEAESIRLLAQGVDGSPKRILDSFSEDPSGVILGTSSFWEGVDLAGNIIKALVLARLPFQVPTAPIFAARSDQYEDSFHEYALPQAVLRFRQGIGRLIRSSEDRGSIVVLDNRIISRRYGKAFLDSIPPCTVKTVASGEIAEHAARWVGINAREATM